jgi:hypothetical protein
MIDIRTLLRSANGPRGDPPDRRRADPAGGAHAEENKMNLICDCGSDLFKVTDASEVACAKCRKPAGYLTSQHPAIPPPGPGHSPSMWQIERMRKTDHWIDAYGNHINLGDQVTSATTPGWPGCLPDLGDAVFTVTGYGRSRIKVTALDQPGRVYTCLPENVRRLAEDETR